MKTILVYTKHHDEEFLSFNEPPFKIIEGFPIKTYRLKKDKEIIIVYFNNKNKSDIMLNVDFLENTELLVFYHGEKPIIPKTIKNVHMISHSTENQIDRKSYEQLQNSNNLVEDFDLIWEKYDIKKEETDLLEIKLKLLHCCLTPVGIEKINWEMDGTVNIKTVDNESAKEEIQKKNEISVAREIFETLKKVKDGPFGPIYINKLKELRESLLPEY